MKYIKIFRIMILALISALLVMFIAPAPAFAQPTLYVSPNHGKIGKGISVYGYNYSSGKTVYIYFSSDQALVGELIDVDVTAYELVATTIAGITEEEEGIIDTYFFVPPRLTDGYTTENVRNGIYYVYTTYSTSKVIRSLTTFTVEGVSEIALSIEEGIVGTEVKITGIGFGNREEFTIEYFGQEVPIKSGDTATNSIGNFQCFIDIPKSTAGAHSVTVTGDVSDLEAKAEFIVLPKITISPQAGAAGDKVTVRGTGFGDRVMLNIFFGNFRVVTGRTTDKYGSFDITFEVSPSGPGIHNIEVVDGNGNFSREKFTIGAISATLNPTSGYAGTEIKVSGVGFAASKMVTIKFANVQVRTTATDASGKFSDQFIVPRHSSGNYNVVVTDGVNTSTATFTIIASVSLSQTTGNIGTDLTINGNGFSGAVTIKYDDAIVATTAADASGIFVASFKVPASIHGKHIVTASDAMNTIQAEFNMESVPPPKPTLLLPVNDSREKSQVSFQWESVTDPSGVIYTFQIASDVHFTSMVLEKKGLIIPEYTLIKTEKLSSTSKEEPYYWRVKAIDGAANESAWSEPGSFYVSLFPNWVKYTLITLGAVIAALLIFWLGMKTSQIQAARRMSDEEEQ